MRHRRESSLAPYIIGGAALVVIIFAAAFYFAISPRETSTVVAQPEVVRAEVQGDLATISYTSRGFSPNTITIKKGDTIKFVDQGTGKMWVGSNPHPDHTGYAGTARAAHCARATNDAFDQCGASAEYSFTFEKTGTWKYHNHVIASHGGTVVVTE